MTNERDNRFDDAASDWWIETEDGHVICWPFCVVPGCPNRICLAKNEVKYCWPHSSSGQTVQELIDANATVDAS